VLKTSLPTCRFAGNPGRCARWHKRVTGPADGIDRLASHGAGATLSVAATCPARNRARLSAVFLRQRADGLARGNSIGNLAISPTAAATLQRRQFRFVASSRLKPRTPCPPLHQPRLSLLSGDLQAVGHPRQRLSQFSYQLAKTPRLFGRYQPPPGQPMSDQGIAAAQHSGRSFRPTRSAAMSASTDSEGHVTLCGPRKRDRRREEPKRGDFRPQAWPGAPRERTGSGSPAGIAKTELGAA
jgi:hypothetical protein